MKDGQTCRLHSGEAVKHSRGSHTAGYLHVKLTKDTKLKIFPKGWGGNMTFNVLVSNVCHSVFQSKWAAYPSTAYIIACLVPSHFDWCTKAAFDFLIFQTMNWHYTVHMTAVWLQMTRPLWTSVRTIKLLFLFIYQRARLTFTRFPVLLPS